ncbi:pyrroline-5-carboxylate reductase [bacterium]|nr:MAG: pyrroline-5-carboxylate reductase [bacterium]
MAALPKITIIGLGNMGEAILSGLLGCAAAEPSMITGVEADAGRGKELAAKYGIKVTQDIAEGCKNSPVVILAVKPKDAGRAVSVLAGTGSTLISICAGLTLGFFQEILGDSARIVRVMPNTPALIGEGASAYCPAPSATDGDCLVTETIFGAVGTVVRVSDEKLMDAVTGLSGSGPAYVFLFLEALADAGVAAGLDRATARALAAQTVKGSAAMAQSSPLHTGELKDRVCSPGGTTIEGVRTLEGTGFRSAVMEAVLAAVERSRALGG